MTTTMAKKIMKTTKMKTTKRSLQQRQLHCHLITFLVFCYTTMSAEFAWNLLPQAPGFHRLRIQRRADSTASGRICPLSSIHNKAVNTPLKSRTRGQERKTSKNNIVTDRPTDRRTVRPTDQKVAYRVACPRLTTKGKENKTKENKAGYTAI